MPSIVDNCQGDLRSLDAAAFNGALSNGLADSIGELNQRLASLAVRIPQLATALADLSIQITDTSATADVKAEAKKVADDDLTKANNNILALTSQIAAINTEIAASPSNADLLTLRTKRQQELSAEQTLKNAATNKVAVATQELTVANTARDAKKLESANAAFEYAAKKADVVAANAALVQAELQRASLEETMTRLGSDAIVYDVKATETAFAGMRPFVSRFNEIFANGASFSTSLTYDALDLSIPMTGLSGTVDFPMEFSTAGALLDVAVQYKMTHGNPSDLSIVLIAPSGAQVTLRSQSSGLLNDIVSSDGRTAEGFTARTVSLQSLNNSQTKGIWKLRINDNSGSTSAGIGKLQSVKLLLKLKATP